MMVHIYKMHELVQDNAKKQFEVDFGNEILLKSPLIILISLNMKLASTDE